jgi:hypothetical protein
LVQELWLLQVLLLVFLLVQVLLLYWMNLLL